MNRPEKPSNEPQYHCHNFGASISLQEILDYTQNFKVPANEIFIESYYDYNEIEVNFYIKPLPEEEFKKRLDRYKKDLEKYEKYLEDTKEQREKEEVKKQETLRKARLKKLKAEQRTLKAAIARLEKELKG